MINDYSLSGKNVYRVIYHLNKKPYVTFNQIVIADNEQEVEKAISSYDTYGGITIVPFEYNASIVIINKAK